MAQPVPTGGEFLFQETGSTPLMCPERFSDEQKQYLETAQRFSRQEVLPKTEAIEKKAPGLMRELLRKAGELGLLMIDIPEAHGGLGLEKTTSLLVAEAKSMNGSWSVTFGGHTCIGTLPIVWFGNAAQKSKYLPKLATGEWVAAYALTESGSGSDALGAKTTATKSTDGKHWVLNGSKQFITNAAFADVFIVFAKVDGDKFTGFIVDRSTPGLSIGPEEHKMGIRGSSTCAVIFEDAKVPVENLLGEPGQGHKIAFNILNVGRLKLGVGVLGAMKLQLSNAVAYAAERKQFSTPILEFGLIREKIARTAGLIYAVESMAYRTSGLIDARLHGLDPAAADHDAKTIAAIEEFAVEASILKVFGSEALGQLVDEAVQIHGGYGYIEEYSVERAYRDARINRIFEGTNEINRMLITGMLLKRSMKGVLPLFDFAQTVSDELDHNALPKASPTGPLAQAALTASYLKRIAAWTLKVAAEVFGPELEKQQLVLASVSDIVIDAFAVDSMVARTRQVAPTDPVRIAMTRQLANAAASRSMEAARRALCASAKGDALTQHLKKLQLLSSYDPFNPIEAIQTIVEATRKGGGYTLG